MRGPYNEQVSLALWGQRDDSRPHVWRWWGPSDVLMVTADPALLHANGGAITVCDGVGGTGSGEHFAAVQVFAGTSWLRTGGTPPE